MKLFRDVSHILKCQVGIKLFLPCFRFTLGGGVRQLVGYDAINLKVNSHMVSSTNLLQRRNLEVLKLAYKFFRTFLA